MDTNDLKNLFNEQSGASRLTPSGITRHVKRQQAVRRAGAAGFVTLAAVGASLGGVWLNSQNTDTVPAEPLPAPSVTTTVTPPSPEPTTVEGASTDLVACTIDAPASWTQALQGPFDQAGSTAPWIEKDGSNLIWHHGDDAIAFADDAQVQMGSGSTDGRYVLYWADAGRPTARPRSGIRTSPMSSRGRCPAPSRATCPCGPSSPMGSSGSRRSTTTGRRLRSR